LTNVLLPQAETELQLLPLAERAAILSAARKLEALGPDLGYPHSSAVRDADRLRELRPRGGRSAWRAFYRRFGDVFVVAAVGSEAEAHPRGFKRAVAAAEARMPEFRDAWDRSAFAREVAIRVVSYRADRGLTQAQLAGRSACSSR
jgi:hypothetical protein